MKETSEDGDRCLHEGLEELDRGHGVGHGAPVSGELLEAGAGNKESRVGKSEFQLEADLLRHQVPTFITSCKCCHLVANWGPLPEVEASDAFPVPDGKILFCYGLSQGAAGTFLEPMLCLSALLWISGLGSG